MSCTLPTNLACLPRLSNLKVTDWLYNIYMAVSGQGNRAASTSVDEVHSTDFTVAAGALSVDLTVSSDFTGTINGAAWSGTSDFNFFKEAAAGFALPAFTVVVTTGTVREHTIRP